MKRTATGRIHRPGVLLAGAILSAAALTGCSYMSPDAANEPYDPSDGMGAVITVPGSPNQIRLLNMMAVMPESGQQANLVGSVVNGTDRDLTLSFTLLDSAGAQAIGSTGTLAVEPQSVTALGGPEQKSVVFAPVEAAPGQVLQLAVRTDVGGATLSLPVMSPEGDLEDYTGPSASKAP